LRVALFAALGGVLYGAYVAGGFIVGASVLATSLQNAATAAAAAPPPPNSTLSARVASIVSSTGVNLPVDGIVSAVPLLPDWQGTERINVLLLGIDQRDEEIQVSLPTRTDSMIVVSIDPVTKTAAMISFPRDIWLQIPGFGEQRINEAYPFGELYRVDGGGAGLAARTIEQNFGLPVPYYAVVNFYGFENIVDTLGGIVVDVPRPVKDDEYPTPDYGIQRLYVAIGPQLMDGAQALKYARTRHTDNDINRASRQQQVLLAIRKRALRPETFSQLPKLVDQGLRTVKTNFTATELLALGKLASQVDTTSLNTLVIQYPMVFDYRGPGGAQILIPRKDEIRNAIRKVLEPPVSAPAPAAPPAS
jgi:LCP family protein required for cell wall assembly